MYLPSHLKPPPGSNNPESSPCKLTDWYMGNPLQTTPQRKVSLPPGAAIKPVAPQAGLEAQESFPRPHWNF